jgi:DNA-binding transcriptional regulator YdaS (Cro superfamily)
MLTEDAIKHFKTKTALAAALGIKPPSIADWGEIVPKQRQYELERITSGKLKADWTVKPTQKKAA